MKTCIAMTSLMLVMGAGLSAAADDTAKLSDFHKEDAVVMPVTGGAATIPHLTRARANLSDFAACKVAVSLPQARIAVEKTEIDAGDVWRGDKPHYEFTIKNTGDAPLEIVAKPNCGCTVAKYDKVIEPGKSGNLIADMNTATFSGKILKTIDVSTNDPANPGLSLRLLANVKPIVTVLPSNLPTFVLRNGQPTVQELDIQIDPVDPGELTRITSNAPYVTTKIERKARPGLFHVTVTIQPEAPMGRSTFALFASTTSKREPQFNIICLCEKGILAMPPNSYFGSIRQSTPLPANVTIMLSRRDAAFHLTGIECNDPSLQVRKETVEEGHQYRLTLVYNGGWPAGFIQRKLIITTDDPDQPKIEIPVMANVRMPMPAAKQ